MIPVPGLNGLNQCSCRYADAVGTFGTGAGVAVVIQNSPEIVPLFLVFLLTFLLTFCYIFSLKH